VAAALRTQEFLRLRVGVGRPERGDPRPLADFVLSDFPVEVDVRGLVGRAADAAEAVARDGLDEAQQRFNERV
jgi:PTH1 family peptidyl-tRNA hydrolase